MKLKKLLMYKPETITEINNDIENNNKCILLGYEQIPEEKENEYEYEYEYKYEEGEENNIDISKKEKIEKEKKIEYKNRLFQINENTQNHKKSKMNYNKDKNLNFKRLLTPYAGFKNDNYLNKTSYIKTFSNEINSTNNYNLTEKNIIKKYNKNNIIQFPKNKNNFNATIEPDNNNKYEYNNKYNNTNINNNNNYENNISFSNNNNNNNNNINNNNNKTTKRKINNKNNLKINNDFISNNKKNLNPGYKNKTNKKINNDNNNNKRVNLIANKSIENINNITNEEEDIIKINKKPDNLEIKKKYYKNPFHDSLDQNNMQLKEIKIKFILTKDEYSILMREKAKFNNPLIE